MRALSRLIPPPRVHRHRYHGGLAPGAALRARVVASGRREHAARACRPHQPGGRRHASRTGCTADRASCAPPPGRAAADRRTLPLGAPARPHLRGLPAVRCPGCGADIRILAFLTAAERVDAILRHLGLPATPPPLSPARGPPQHDLAFDADHGPYRSRPHRSDVADPPSPRTRPTGPLPSAPSATSGADGSIPEGHAMALEIPIPVPPRPGGVSSVVS